MVLVEQEVSDNIIAGITPKKRFRGFCPNSMVGISILGGNASFCGKVKNDELGLHFEKNMENTGLNFFAKCLRPDCQQPDVLF